MLNAASAVNAYAQSPAATTAFAVTTPAPDGSSAQPAVAQAAPAKNGTTETISTLSQRLAGSAQYPINYASELQGRIAADFDYRADKKNMDRRAGILSP